MQEVIDFLSVKITVLKKLTKIMWRIDMKCAILYASTKKERTVIPNDRKNQRIAF